MDKYKDLDLTALQALREETRAALAAFAEIADPTDEQIADATELATEFDDIEAEVTSREAAVSASAERAASLRARFAVKAEPEASADEPVEDEVAEEEVEEEEVQEVTDEVPAAARSTVETLAAKTKRPVAPSSTRKRVSIVASANVPGFDQGTGMDDLATVAQAVINRAKGFSPPSGDGRTENLQKFGTASFRLDFPEDLQINRGTDEMEVLSRAADQSRLEGGSLVAAGGWCSPSETLYDLCESETLDGLISVPEVQVNRGGFRFTKGPNFQDFYTDADLDFVQTEAQAIAGETKPCNEVECPEFEEIRLDAIGLCLKIPILTNAAYPELIRRWVNGTMVAHQHKVNANVISRMLALVPAANQFTETGANSTTWDLISRLDFEFTKVRDVRRLSMNASFEVILPHWLKPAIRKDLAIRNGMTSEKQVTDAHIQAAFSQIKANVQFVYDWQDLGVADTDYPATVKVLYYTAGTFVKGVSDVINLSNVYDAASLAVNTYTGLFMEQGLLVANMCDEAYTLDVTLCNGGRLGVQDITCA